MKGITIYELYDFLLYNHEIEFSYNDTLFSMEPHFDGSNSYFAIWNCTDGGKCIGKTLRSGFKDNEAIEQLLNIKCFEGKTFMEIENDVVDVIY